MQLLPLGENGAACNKAVSENAPIFCDPARAQTMAYRAESRQSGWKSRAMRRAGARFRSRTVLWMWTGLADNEMLRNTPETGAERAIGFMQIK